MLSQASKEEYEEGQLEKAKAKKLRRPLKLEEAITEDEVKDEEALKLEEARAKDEEKLKLEEAITEDEAMDEEALKLEEAKTEADEEAEKAMGEEAPEAMIEKAQEAMDEKAPKATIEEAMIAKAHEATMSPHLAQELAAKLHQLRVYNQLAYLFEPVPALAVHPVPLDAVALEAQLPTGAAMDEGDEAAMDERKAAEQQQKQYEPVD